MAQLNSIVSLAPGTPIKLTNRGSITGPGTLLFTVPARPSGGEFSLMLQLVGTFSGATSSLQVDITTGGTGSNLVNYITTGPSSTTPFVVGISSSTPILSGALYALDFTALTSGSLDVWAVIN